MQLNGIMFQGFEWYLADDGLHYQRLIDMAPGLAANGVTAIWLPPAYKGSSSSDNGYGVYDLYDLGEFDQKGTVRTKYGTKDELLNCIQTFKDLGIHVYLDVVLNHRLGADETETVLAEKMDQENRGHAISDPYEIEAWTKFTFPGRGDTYSSQKLHWYHFTGSDYDNKNEEKGLFRFIGENKYWAGDVSDEYGNYDYLMGTDVDFAHPEVREDLFNWVNWFIETTGADGFRLDAVKHMSAKFVRDMVAHIRERKGDQFFFVAEYWNADAKELDEYLDETDMLLTLFDVSLHFKFHQASIEEDKFDLRTIFDDTVVVNDPLHTVTFVENHDTQPGQSLESEVLPWFKPQAYALILLREAGYPCVFYGDYCGTENGSLKPIGAVLDKLMALRRIYAKGDQEDYFEKENCIGWVRDNFEAAPMAVIVSNDQADSIRMYVGEDAAGDSYADYLGHLEDKIIIDEEGYGEFPVAERSVCCWLKDQMTLNIWEAKEAEDNE